MSPNSKNKLAAILITSVIWTLSFAILWILILCLTGCTVTPPNPKARNTARFDGNSLNSGIVAAIYLFPKTREGFQGFLVTQDWVDGYNFLASQYGTLFDPPVRPYLGLEPALPEVAKAYGIPYGFMVDAQHMVFWRNLRVKPLTGAEKESLISRITSKLQP